jgi:hypothetical protein
MSGVDGRGRKRRRRGGGLTAPPVAAAPPAAPAPPAAAAPVAAASCAIAAVVAHAGFGPRPLLLRPAVLFASLPPPTEAASGPAAGSAARVLSSVAIAALVRIRFAVRFARSPCTCPHTSAASPPRAHPRPLRLTPLPVLHSAELDLPPLPLPPLRCLPPFSQVSSTVVKPGAGSRFAGVVTAVRRVSRGGGGETTTPQGGRREPRWNVPSSRRTR